MIVSVVTRSVDGDEQFSGSYRARIDRHTGQPGHGVESRPRPGTQSTSHLCNRPPHKFLKGLVLVQYPTTRSVFNVLRAPPLREVRDWLPPTSGPERPPDWASNQRARCQTPSRFAALQNRACPTRGAPLRDRQIPAYVPKESDNFRGPFRPAKRCRLPALQPWPC